MRDELIVFATLIATLILFIHGRWRYDIVALLALLTLAVLRIVPPAEAFSGFGHPAVITVAAVLAVVLIVTMFLSDLVNNAAAAVLMAPIALGVAAGLDASPDPFLMSVAIGASCAFLTPIGHQANALVMGPGGYRFGDYWRLGLPLEIIVVVVAVPLLLWAWPMF